MADLDAILSEYDFIVAIDASGSMGETDMPGNRSRWEYMQETATAFCRDIEKLDSDGIGVVTFGGSNVASFDSITTNKVKEVFASRSPRGATPMAQALEAALKLAGKSNKKDFILVFTDGAPDDAKAVEDVIKAASAKLDSDDALTILFVQVGNDPIATKFLRSLDDNLKGAKFDIVDVKTMDEAEQFPSTAAMVAAAIAD